MLRVRSSPLRSPLLLSNCLPSPCARRRPADAESPDPDAIGPEFVSQGAAVAALQQGSVAAQLLMGKCSQRLQAAPY